jgi:hypothetical protein
MGRGAPARFAKRTKKPFERFFLRSGAKALKSGVEYQKVDKAIGQLSDEDVAKLAERSRQAQNDFAAGRISDRDLMWIIVIALGIVILALVLR